MALIISIFAALATGGSVIAGQYLGRRDVDNAKKASNQMIKIAFVISIIITILLYLCKPLILHNLFGSISEEVEHAANQYFMVVAMSVPFLVLYNSGATNFITEKFDYKMIKRILNIGAPFGFENGMFYLGRLVVLSIVSLFGTASIAANSISGNIVMFEVLPGVAMNLGLSVIIARCIGAGDYEQAKYYKKKVRKIVHVSFIISSIIVIASMIFCRIALSYVFALEFHMGMLGTWAAMFVDWIDKAIIYEWHYKKDKWTKFKAI